MESILNISKNVNVLYLIFLLSVINILWFFYYNHYKNIIIFITLGLFISLITKNMIIVLGISLLLVNIYFILTENKKETMRNRKNKFFSNIKSGLNKGSSLVKSIFNKSKDAIKNAERKISSFSRNARYKKSNGICKTGTGICDAKGRCNSVENNAGKKCRDANGEHGIYDSNLVCIKSAVQNAGVGAVTAAVSANIARKEPFTTQEGFEDEGFQEGFEAEGFEEGLDEGFQEGLQNDIAPVSTKFAIKQFMNTHINTNINFMRMNDINYMINGNINKIPS